MAPAERITRVVPSSASRTTLDRLPTNSKELLLLYLSIHDPSSGNDADRPRNWNGSRDPLSQHRVGEVTKLRAYETSSTGCPFPSRVIRGHRHCTVTL
jgi:hypothetical protein